MPDLPQMLHDRDDFGLARSHKLVELPFSAGLGLIRQNGPQSVIARQGLPIVLQLL